MTTFQIIIRKIGIHFSKPIWSFIRNCVFWLFRLNKIGAARKEMDAVKSLKIETLMNLFKWTEDKYGDWYPWVSTLLIYEMKDDCDGAAALSKWWFKQHDIKADIFNLYSDKSGHTVCVTRDRTKMVSNDRVLELNPANWEKEMLKYFGGKYTEII